MSADLPSLGPLGAAWSRWAAADARRVALSSAFTAPALPPATMEVRGIPIASPLDTSVLDSLVDKHVRRVVAAQEERLRRRVFVRVHEPVASGITVQLHDRPVVPGLHAALYPLGRFTAVYGLDVTAVRRVARPAGLGVTFRLTEFGTERDDVAHYNRAVDLLRLRAGRLGARLDDRLTVTSLWWENWSGPGDPYSVPESPPHQTPLAYARAEVREWSLLGYARLVEANP